MPNDIHTSTQNSDHLIHPKYRPDIDGLRAIAILSVVAFHTYPTGGKGGFIGVDIFFVISGFLISTILLQNLEKGSFSFVEFYIRRINRIFPALILVLIATFLIGWFVMLADEYALLGKHILAGAGFVSNFLLLRESGYFDIAADMKPLLHLWSLGIEEQYYLVWPPLIWFAYKWKKYLFSTILVLCFASFVFNVTSVSHNPIETFLLPLTRFWELLVGSALAYFMLFNQSLVQRLRTLNGNFLSLCGIVLILTGIIYITKDKVFPGWWALLPTIGAALVILAGSQAWFNRKVLSSRLLVWFGLISFPLYLWHWPLLAFAQIMVGQLPAREIRFAIDVVSIVLAYMTYRWIEKPIRFGKSGSSKTIIMIILMAVVGCVGYSCLSLNGFPFRKISLLSGGEISANNINPDSDQSPQKSWSCRSTVNVSEEFNKNCLLHTLVDSKFRIVVWGDSHAYAWMPVFKQIAMQNNYELYVISTPGCPPINGVRRTDGVDSNSANCKGIETTGKILDSIVKLKPDLVILTSWWSLYSHGLVIDGVPYKDHHFLTTHPTEIATQDTSRAALKKEIPATLKVFERNNIPVIVFKNPPVLHFSVANSRKSINEIQPTTLEHEELSDFTNQILSKNNNYKIFDPATKLCRESCVAKVDGNWIYTDFTHLSIYGAMYFQPEIDSLLKANLGKR